MINVLVTAAGGGGHGAQILKALSLASPSKYRLYCADAAPIKSGKFGVSKWFKLPFANNANYMDELINLCMEENIRVVFHGCEQELLVFSKNRKEFSRRDILVPMNSERIIDVCLDKSKTNQILLNNGFVMPKSRKVTCLNDISTIDWFPVVVKPYVGGGGSSDVYIAQNETELKAIWDYVGSQDITSRFIVQEYVGDPMNEYTVGVLHDLGGNYLNSVAVHRDLKNTLSVKCSVKNRTNRSELGEKLVISSGISQGKIGRFPDVTEPCKELACAMRSQGPLNFQCRLVGSKVYIFEINPRLSGTTSLRAMIGLNEPDILIRRHLMHESIPVDEEYEHCSISRMIEEYKNEY